MTKLVREVESPKPPPASPPVSYGLLTIFFGAIVIACWLLMVLVFLIGLVLR